MMKRYSDSRVISPQQTTFISSGRHIHCNISLVFWGINMLDRKVFCDNIDVKFDITKAFNTPN